MHRPSPSGWLSGDNQKSILFLIFFIWNCFSIICFGSTLTTKHAYSMVYVRTFCWVLKIYSQPVFSFADTWAAHKFPDSAFVNKFYMLRPPPPFSSPCRMNLFRLSFRTAYVAATTGLAVFFPYFNQVLGVLGASFFWPIAIYFPVEMYIVQKRVAAWTRPWLLLQMFSVGCLLICIFAFIGSIQGIISEKFS